jgi:hypothetical protein
MSHKSSQASPSFSLENLEGRQLLSAAMMSHHAHAMKAQNTQAMMSHRDHSARHMSHQGMGSGQGSGMGNGQGSGMGGGM